MVDRQPILVDDLGRLPHDLLVMSEQKDLCPGRQLVENPKPGRRASIVKVDEEVIENDRECASLIDDVFKCCQTHGQVELIARASA